jgi:tetratricopeptide (TPR) repeat protein
MNAFPSSRAALLIAVACLAVTACKKDPTPAELKLAKGNELYRAQDYAGAAAALQESLALDPNQPQAVWDKTSFSWKKAGKPDLAGETLVKAAATRTKPEEKLANLRNGAGMYLEGRILDKAEETFVEVLKLDPKDSDALAWVGEIYAQRGGARKADAPVVEAQLDKALEIYERLITLAPAAPMNYVNKRIALTKLTNHYVQLVDKLTDPAEKAKAQEKLAKLKATLEETSAKMTEVMKAAKAAGAASPAAPAK